MSGSYELAKVEDPALGSVGEASSYASSSYAPLVPTGSDTPVISFVNLTVEHVAASALESAASNTISFLRKALSGKLADQQQSKKVILHGVTGAISGGFWGILGLSGSGKSTLLNALAKRLDPVRIQQTGGSLSLNGQSYNKRNLKDFAAYLMQDDVLHAEFTIYEMLWHTAYLRLGSALTVEERKKRIDELLVLLEIDHRRDVIVGDSRNKGISGGERKRLALAMELLTKPKLLFLDEPTTGLDSTNALAVIGSLKRLVDRNECTVITSIHQPQTKIFEQLDKTILMKNGSIAYLGSTKGAVSYFTSLGFPLPFRTNPADHLIDVLSSNTKEDAQGFHSSLQYLAVTVPDGFGLDKPTLPARVETKWPVQFGVLFLRSLHQSWRRRLAWITNFLCVILIAIFVSYGPWNSLGNSTVNLGKRPAVLFYCVVHQGLVYSYQNVYQFPLEREIMLRERHAGTYRVSAYFLGKCFADFCAQVISPIIFSLIVYPLVGLNTATPEKFRNFLLIMILACNAATSMVNMISCLFVSLRLTVVVIGVSWEITRLFGGWYISPFLLKKFTEWEFLDALSCIKYAFVGISLNEYQDLVLCSPATATAKAVCSLSFANKQIATYGYDQYTVSGCAWYLFVLILGSRLLSYLGLRFIKI